MAGNRVNLNKQAMERFAAHFNPPLRVTACEKVGGKPVADGWMAAIHSEVAEVGLTAVCWGNGYFKTWIEAHTTRDQADGLGQFFGFVLSTMGATAPQPAAAPEPPSAAETVNPHEWAGCQHPRNARFCTPEGEHCGVCGSLLFGPPRREPERDQPQLPQPLTEAERKQFEPGGTADQGLTGFDRANAILDRVTAASPNPEFIDVHGLPPEERVLLAREFPDLRYAIRNDGQRMGFDADGKLQPNPQAGFIAADRLQHLRRRPRAGQSPQRGLMAGAALAGQAATERLSGLGAALCDHEFKRNSIGGQYTCWKCGIGMPKERPAAAEIDAELREKMAAQEAQYAAYQAAMREQP